jgi:hypothetical protein
LQKQTVLSRRNKAEAPKEEQGGAYGDEAPGPYPGADHGSLGEPEPPQAAAAALVPGTTSATVPEKHPSLPRGTSAGNSAAAAAAAAAMDGRSTLLSPSMLPEYREAREGGVRRRRVLLLALGRRHRGANKRCARWRRRRRRGRGAGDGEPKHQCGVRSEEGEAASREDEGPWTARSGYSKTIL